MSAIRKAVSAALCLAIITEPIPLHANAMDKVFDNINANVNVTSPAIIQGQTMNAYTGGSMFMRAPSRTYQLVTATPPSWGAGCGGIDLYLGGFSHINKDQFVAMLKNIGSNAVGYAFKLAVQNLCPTCDNVMTALQTTANGINRMNIDSCQAAQGIVNAMAPTAWEKGRTNAAINSGTFTNVFSDITDAWLNVARDENTANNTNREATARNPDLNKKLPHGNVVWKALKEANAKHGMALTDDDLLIMMSMIGTVILDAKGQAKEPLVVPPLDIELRTLIGTDYDPATGNAKTNITLPVYRCIDGNGADQCLLMATGSTTATSFKGRVSKKMFDMADTIAARGTHASLGDLKAFVNATDFPVYKMIAITSSLNDTKMADALIGRYQDIIAAKYAEVYIYSVGRDLKAALGELAARSDSSLGTYVKDIQPEVNNLMQKTRSEMQTAYANAMTTMRVAEELQHIERSLTANISPMLSKSLAFGRSLK
jgi:conjugative transfer pilus assembly protein TraH